MSEDTRAHARQRRKITNLVTMLIVAIVCGLVIGKVGSYLRNYGHEAEALGSMPTTMPDNVDRQGAPMPPPNETPFGTVNNAIPTVDPVYAACRQWAEAQNAGAWTFDSNGCRAAVNGQWVTK